MKTEEILNIINAYKGGKTIEYRMKFDLDMHKNPFYDWDTVPSNANYNWNFAMYEYRIKGESTIRPYKNSKEFFQAMKEHGPAISNGFIVVRATNDGIYYYSMIAEKILFMGYSDLVTLKWQDGTPCCIKEN